MNMHQTLPASVLVFDVNETLLDVNALRSRFERLFGDGAVLKLWFAQVLLYSQTLTQIEEYSGFGAVAGSALRMLADAHNIASPEDEVSAVVEAMASLPPYPEVANALRRLRTHGFRTVALTNSAQAVADKQIEHAGLTALFDAIYSVESVRAYKPAAEPYLHVASELAVEPSRMTMVAAHPWDLIGASACGYRTAFVQRPGTAWFPLAERPRLIGRDLDELADQLISADHAARIAS